MPGKRIPARRGKDGYFSMRAPVALTLLASLLLVGGGFAYWNQQKTSRLPDGLASANGRIEVERVDIASKYAGRVAEISVKEGDFVEKGAVVAQLDTTELLAQLAGLLSRARDDNRPSE